MDWELGSFCVACYLNVRGNNKKYNQHSTFFNFQLTYSTNLLRISGDFKELLEVFYFDP
jgi:hypothetical protein